MDGIKGLREGEAERITGNTGSSRALPRPSSVSQALRTTDRYESPAALEKLLASVPSTGWAPRQAEHCLNSHYVMFARHSK
ncbi:hypothetical protein E2C01_008918 [Portunus trituberculatus]|uniref:Uncharacterized protein n=1 Tax=Portunus trituberculatus TaxID=210409 RepID=A0A5B7D5M7_PORTR|nr:hypothetical protein [Portunus trituberculatus]